jgi:adenylate kinase family enzyme
MAKGELVPDEVVIAMIASNALTPKRSGRDFSMTDFHVPVSRLLLLKQCLRSKVMKIDMMLALDVSHAELGKRLLLTWFNVGQGRRSGCEGD